ncbi:MAG: hypothetical protein CMN56_01435 [Sneathiella sp.]|uniref:hypothetical protein n=1 Tax=Sneathiella sp. TaxID=1964365 RepID=UPI000C400AC5|nr:hypothetical protein [Sneathiella sp.]MAZ01778.1 hypothetical protein [Sneathiella sp.]
MNMAEQHTYTQNIAIKDGKLFLRRCVKTGIPVNYFHQRCPCCWDNKFESFVSNGMGKIISLVTYHRTYKDSIPSPYDVAVVRLFEGLEVIVRVDQNSRKHVLMGSSVFVEVTNEGLLLVHLVE